MGFIKSPNDFNELIGYVDYLEPLDLSFNQVSLKMKGEGFIKLHNALREDNNAELLRLLKKTSINVRDNQGNTFLHLAIMQGKSETVKLLVENDADVAVRNDKNYLPLHHACNLTLNNQVFELLIQKSCKFINLEDGYGCSPLVRSIHSTIFCSEETKAKHIDAIKLLVFYGSNVSEENIIDLNRMQLGLGEELENLSLKYKQNITQAKQSARDIFNAANGLACAGMPLEITHKILDYFNTDNKIETETFKQVKNYSTEFAYKRSGSGFIKEILEKKSKISHFQTILNTEEQAKHIKNVVCIN
ncbi:MAG: ankyrin repeat domain-containing protein [Alphaproteobacteria bacterium]